MALELAGAEPHLDRVAGEWGAAGAPDLTWVPRLVGAQYRAVEAAWRVADLALEVAGGLGDFPDTDLDEQPRWG